MDVSKLAFGNNWYPEENDGSHSFRWMGKEATLFLKKGEVGGKRFLFLTAGHSFHRENLPLLEVFANGKKIGEKHVDITFCSYLFHFEEEGEITFELKVDRVFKVPPDPRQLGIMVRKAEVLNLSDQEEPLYGNGWYEWEYGEFFPFHWLSKNGELWLPPNKLRANKYISFFLFSEFADLTQKLILSSGKKILFEIPLLNKWNYYSLPLQSLSVFQPDDASPLSFSLNKLFPERYHPGDPRDLGVRVSPVEFHNDDVHHENVLFFHKNALLNHQEMREGKIKLESYPQNLGLDLYGKCNMKPPCVYCLWDRMKDLEEEYVDVVVDEGTLEGYGPFFKSARSLVNCSFGEPLLHPRFQEILEFCERNKKIVEISTNGQAFSKRTIKALLGKPVYLYISLDAASRETYAKIRNESWDSIVPNLILLNQERKKQGNLPKLFMVFMPMKVNKHELEAYFRLCQKINADALVLRPLLYLWNPQIEVDRGGYHFNYEKELLSPEELENIFRQCDEFSKKYGVSVANQFEFGTIQKPGRRERTGENK